MKIFLDVGAHIGETLEIALDPKYGFDKIYAFEPSKDCCDVIRASYDDKRLVICEYGLWDKDSNLPLYNSGGLGASVFKDKPNRHKGESRLGCRFRRRELNSCRSKRCKKLQY